MGAPYFYFAWFIRQDINQHLADVEFYRLYHVMLEGVTRAIYS